MPEQWPPSLQQLLNVANFSESDQDTNIVSTPDTGPIKSRARFTQAETLLTCQIVIGMDDYPTLKDFTKITLQNRTLTFDFDHPITGVPSVYRMDSPEKITPLGPINFLVNMTWRQMP